MPTYVADREDPLVAFNFGFEVPTLDIESFFMEVSGMGSEHEIVEQKVVNSSGVEAVLKLPGRLKWNDITLKRGITSNLDIWDWRKQIEDGQVESARQNGSIVMYDQQGSEKARWNFEKAWPAKVTGPAVKADGNEIAIEEMVLVCESMIRAQ